MKVTMLQRTARLVPFHKHTKSAVMKELEPMNIQKSATRYEYMKIHNSIIRDGVSATVLWSLHARF